MSIKRLLLAFCVASSLTTFSWEVRVDAKAGAGGDGSPAKPFATLQAARDAVRVARKAGKISANESVIVTMAPGDYPQLSPFVLDQEDSGTAAYAPLVYRAEKPRSVRILGGVGLQAKDFITVTNADVLTILPESARGKVMVADVSSVIKEELKGLPDNFVGVPPPPFVFMRGQITEMARWPNAGTYAQFFKKDKVDTDAFSFDDPHTKRWNLERGVWLCGYWTHDWYQDAVKVARIGSEEVTDKNGKKAMRENVIRFVKTPAYGVMNGTYGGHKGRRFYAFNLLEELDAPGEWYYDRKARKLYVYPLDGVAVRDADDVILAVNNSVVFSVKPGTRFVRLQGIDFMGTVASLLSFNVKDGVVDDCQFSCCGRGAFGIGGQARRVRVTNCEVFNVGGSGISIYAGDSKTLTRGEVTVENCRIHKFGQISRTYAGAIGMGGVGNTLRKCELYDAPHLAISSGGVLNIIEYNNIHHVLLETADAGAYYSGRSWLRQGNILRYNYFHDLGRIDGSCVAIYYDDCGSGETAYGNIIHKAGLAFLVGGGRDHPIRNNIISSCLNGISLQSRGMAWPVFNAENSPNRKRGDHSHLLRLKALESVGYEDGAWLDAFPRLANVMNDEWAMPYYDPVENNVFIDVKKHIVNISQGDHFKAEKMAPITGNLIISTVGAKGIATNVAPVIAKGFKTLVGTPQKPIDVGVDSLAAGDFRFLPESIVLKECSGFDVIPFGEIPNTSYARPLTDYVSLVKDVKGKKVWTAALQKALDENTFVRIPASHETYWIDAPVLVPSHRRIDAHGATISLLEGCNTLMLRNANARDGELMPIPADAKRDCDIAITGGTWCDWRKARAGYGRSGTFNAAKRELGNCYGVSTLFYFGNMDGFSLTSVKFVRCAAFAVQCGDATDLLFRHIRFESCFADGLHLNGNLARVRAYDVKGCVGDDLVALNAYDWLNSSINFGPQYDMLFEDLELIPPKKGKGYPAIRIQPAVYRYKDGREVDCAISNVVFRKVRGIRNFKMYAQTPGYEIGKPHEWYKVGSGGNILFEDVDVNFDGPIDCWPNSDYVNQDPVRGHIAVFEFGANLSKVTFKDVTVNFHCDKWPLSHFVLVGPKSCRWFPKKPGGPIKEVFDPDLSCTVGEIVLDGLRVRGDAPAELVRMTSFDNINGDGASTGKGVLNKLTVIPPKKPAEGVCPRHVLNNRHRAVSDAARQKADAWRKDGRQKALDWFKDNQYGRLPPALDAKPHGRPDDQKIDARTITCAGGKVKINVHVSLPTGADAAHPVPVFVFGDHFWNKTSKTKTDVYPGIPTNTITQRGYAYVTWNFNDVAPNTYQKWGEPASSPEMAWSNGVFKVYGCGATNGWGTLSAWAWGFSRVMDWIETRPELDAGRVAILGHSRGGKTALWAGAQDERFALVISNDSGTGGARAQKGVKLPKAETFDFMLNGPIHFWFCPNFRNWLGREQQLPYDASDLLALVAPRCVYVASGSEDDWAGPEGEHLAAVRAADIWHGMGEPSMALIGKWASVFPGMTDHSGKVGYHLRPGPHKLTPYDWDRYLDFADIHLKK